MNEGSSAARRSRRRLVCRLSDDEAVAAEAALGWRHGRRNIGQPRGEEAGLRPRFYFS